MRDFFTSREAAAKLNLSVNSMRVYAHRYGVGKQVYGRWLFSDDDMIRLDGRVKRMPVEIPETLIKPRRKKRAR